MQEFAIIVFARHPTPGRVKTRLAVGVGSEAAATFYKHCAELVIQECLKVTPASVLIFFSALEEEDQVRAWLSPLSHSNRLIYLPQVQSPDLGDRLQDGIRRAFSMGHSRAMVIGTDIPDLTCTHLQAAFDALDAHDAVFGPAQDGGYYLFGLKGPNLPEGIFNGVTWSTSAVLQQNAANVERAGLNLAPLDTLPNLRDIDTIDDLIEWCAVAESGERPEGRTLAAIGKTAVQQAATFVNQGS